jgi:hypothetical protein
MKTNRVREDERNIKRYTKRRAIFSDRQEQINTSKNKELNEHRSLQREKQMSII